MLYRYCTNYLLLGYFRILLVLINGNLRCDVYNYILQCGLYNWFTYLSCPSYAHNLVHFDEMRESS